MAAERNAWGFSLFCDDWREEVGGKYSLMGLYQADLVFAEDIPIALPKFVIFVKYYELKGAFKDDLQLNVFFPWDEKDKPTFTQHFDRAAVDIVKMQRPADEDSELLYNMNLPLVFSPLEITKEGYVSVRMQCGDVTTRLGRLMLRKATPAD